MTHHLTALREPLVVAAEHAGSGPDPESDRPESGRPDSGSHDPSNIDLNCSTLVDRRLLGGLWALATDPEISLARHPFESASELAEWAAAVLGASHHQVLRPGARIDDEVVPAELTVRGPETLRAVAYRGRVALRMQLESDQHRFSVVFLGPDDGSAFDLSLVDLVLQRLRHLANQADQRDRLIASALIDPLTGLGNRAIADEAIASLRIGDGLLVIDMDGLKGLNDRHGHAAGDQTLRDFGAMLCRELRSSDTAARYGGDEVVITMASGTDYPTVGRRLLEQWSRRRGSVTLSGGIAVRRHGETGSTVFERADAVMYSAKQSGGNRIILADS